MSQPSVLPSRPNEREEQFALVVDEVSRKFQAGEPVDLDEYARRHPQWAERLRRLFPAMQCLAELGLSISGSGSPAASSLDQPPIVGVLGDFRISREIGRGGMGVVYEAQQISLGRRVALKVLPFASMLDPRQLVRFQNEARAAASLDHPNIVAIHSVGCERGVHYYAMQYIEGRTLAQVIEAMRASSPLPRAGQDSPSPLPPAGQPDSSPFPRAGEGSGVRAVGDVGRGFPDPAQTPTEGLPGPASPDAPEISAPDSPAESEPQTLNPDPSPKPAPDTDRQPQAAISTKGPHQSAEFFRSVAQLGIQAAEALDHAHQSGVVHRDIKPSNLMVDDQGHLWITDFGLAMTQADPGMTATGDVLGTLRYMSPEQSQGDRRRMDHRTDIYSLGVTLYELVTLQPAFPGDDREAVLRQLADEDPPAPRRLNPAVPRDLETIILKAMAKEPDERYATAQEMADDLERFLADEPIRARRQSLRRHLALWAKRHRPLVAAGVGALAVGLLSLAIGLVRWEQQRAALVEVVGENLEQVTAAIDEDRLPEARQALERAEGRLAAGGPGWLVAQAEDQRRDLEMVGRLDEAQLAASATPRDLEMVVSPGQAKPAVPAGGRGGWNWNWKGADRAYRAAFATYGLDVLGLEPKAAVDRIRAAGIRKRLVGALDHWAYVRFKLRDESAAALWNLAQQADDDFWRQQVRKASIAKDHLALKRLAEAAEAPDQAPISIFMLAKSLETAPSGKQAAESLLRSAQQRHPGDFWLNTELGNLLREDPDSPDRLAESVGFHRAAVAARPDSAIALSSLGHSLLGQGKLTEAIAQHRLAIKINSAFASAHNSLGLALCKRGQLTEAIDEYGTAIKLDPDDPNAYLNLGLVLYDQGKLPEAIEQFRQAVRVEPNGHRGHGNLGVALWKQGKVTEAIEEHRLALKINPDSWESHDNLGVALNDAGKLEEAVKEHGHAIRLKPNSAEAHLNLGNVFWKQGKLAEAVEEYRLAIRLDPNYAGAHCNLGSALDKQGKLAEAIEEYRLAIKLAPNEALIYLHLGRAFEERGKFAEAEREYRAGVKQLPDDSNLHFALASALDNQEKMVEAAEQYRLALKLNPCDARIYNNLGVLLTSQGKMVEAAEQYRLALKLNPSAPKSHFNLGQVLLAQGKVAEAIEEFREAIRLGCAPAYRGLAQALAEQGKVVEAIEVYRERLRVNRDDARMNSSLAWLLATAADPKLRQPAEAVRLAKRAVELEPKKGGSWNTLGAAHYRNGDPKAAIEALGKSTALHSGGDASDWLFLAMAHWQLKQPEEARKWYDKAVAWMEKNKSTDKELLRFRAEAEGLLGIPSKPPAGKENPEKPKGQVPNPKSKT